MVLFVILFVTSGLFIACSAQIDLNECLTNKTCIFYPAHCEEKGNCEKVVSFESQPDGWIVLELFYNGTQPDTNYAAVGFSSDDQMGEETVTHCGFDETNQAGVFLSRNVGKHNQPLNLTDETVAENVELLQANRMPNSIYCKFRQKTVPDIEAQKQFVPDLNQAYYLLLAFGKTDDYRRLAIHSVDEGAKDFPAVISMPVIVSAAESTTSPPTTQAVSSRRLLVLIHGMLMILAWMWLVASAIAAARYLREHWPRTMPIGLKIWFHMHRIMNVIAVLLVILAVLLVFAGKGWRWTGPAVGRSTARNTSAGAFHSIVGYFSITASTAGFILIGAVSVILMLSQPVGALFRCDNGAKNRPIFNWAHRIAGLTAFILAMVAILLTVIFFHVWSARWAAVCIFIIYIIILASTITLLQKASFLAGRQNSSVTYETGNGRQYRGEQINVITKGRYDDKSKTVTAAVVMAFIGLAALLSVLLITVILASL